MKWMSDPYWMAALNMALALSPEHKVILTPDEFVHKRAEFYPVKQSGQFSFLTQGSAFVIPKYDAKLLPPRILRDDFDRRFHCVFANEVFVIYSALTESWTLTEEMEAHIPAFLEQRDQCLSQWTRDENTDGAPIAGKKLPYILDTQKNRILKTLFPHKNYVMEQFMDLSGAPEILKQKVFKYCVTDFRTELSAFCNRSCHYCPVSFLGRKDKTVKMPWEIFQRCVDDLAKIDFGGNYWFCLFNEPTYDREYLLAALDYVDRMLPKCSIKLVSNGDYLTPDYFQELTKRRVDEFTISVHYDGMWNRDRQAERMWEILRRIELPRQGNLEEENRRLIYYVDPGAYNSARLRTLILRSEDFEVHGMDRAGTLNSGVLQYSNLDHCESLMEQLNIAYDGAVVPCCNICADIPELKKWTYGTIQEHGDIFSAYTCGKAAEFRRKFFAPRREDEYTPDLCRTCSMAELDGEGKIYRLADPLRREIYDCWISKLK